MWCLYVLWTELCLDVMMLRDAAAILMSTWEMNPNWKQCRGRGDVRVEIKP